jgi:hypothetical protein
VSGLRSLSRAARNTRIESRFVARANKARNNYSALAVRRAGLGIAGLQRAIALAAAGLRCLRALRQ